MAGSRDHETHRSHVCFDTMSSFLNLISNPPPPNIFDSPIVFFTNLQQKKDGCQVKVFSWRVAVGLGSPMGSPKRIYRYFRVGFGGRFGWWRHISLRGILKKMEDWKLESRFGRVGEGELFFWNMFFFGGTFRVRCFVWHPLDFCLSLLDVLCYVIFVPFCWPTKRVSDITWSRNSILTGPQAATTWVTR